MTNTKEKAILSATKEFAKVHGIHYDDKTEGMILNAIREAVNTNAGEMKEGKTYFTELKALISDANRTVCNLWSMDKEKSGSNRVHSDLDFANKKLSSALKLLEELPSPQPNRNPLEVLTAIIKAHTGKDLGESYNMCGGTTLTQLIVKAMKEYAGQPKQQGLTIQDFVDIIGNDVVGRSYAQECLDMVQSKISQPSPSNKQEGIDRDDLLRWIETSLSVESKLGASDVVIKAYLSMRSYIISLPTPKNETDAVEGKIECTIEQLKEIVKQTVKSIGNGKEFRDIYIINTALKTSTKQ